MKDCYIDGIDALQEMCNGYGSQQIAYQLIEVDGIWHGKSLEQGAARVRACKSRSKPEFFHLAEIIAITNFTHRYDGVFFICDELGLSRPHPLSLEQLTSQLRDSVETAAAALVNATDMIGKLAQLPSDPPTTLPLPRAVQFSQGVPCAAGAVE